MHLIEILYGTLMNKIIYKIHVYKEPLSIE